MMESSAWCSHEHTVIVRMGTEGFTLESAFSTSDMYVSQVRVTRPVPEPEKQRITFEGWLVGPRGGEGAHVVRQHMTPDAAPTWVMERVDAEFAQMGCGR